MNWLDSKLELEQEYYSQIKKTELQEYIIKMQYDYRIYENIDFYQRGKSASKMFGRSATSHLWKGRKCFALQFFGLF